MGMKKIADMILAGIGAALLAGCLALAVCRSVSDAANSEAGIINDMINEQDYYEKVE